MLAATVLDPKSGRALKGTYNPTRDSILLGNSFSGALTGRGGERLSPERWVPRSKHSTTLVRRIGLTFPRPLCSPGRPFRGDDCIPAHL